MITQFGIYTQNEIKHNPDEIEKVLAEYIGSFEPRLYCFEGYWNSNIYDSVSTKPFMENIGNLIGEKVEIGHRYFESKEQLDYYLKWPKGIIWGNPVTYGTTAFYFSSHASHNGLELPMGIISKNDLKDIFKDGFGDFPNILYFGCCSLFEDEQFGWDLLEASQSKGILGFTKKVGFTVGMITDLLFFSSFYLYSKQHNPFENLFEIFNSVIEAFPAAKDAGFTLFV